MRSAIFTFLILMCNFNSIAQTTISHSVYFDVDKSALKSEEQQKLDLFITSLSGKNIQKLQVTGHTDSDASVEYNNALSARRVESVKRYLTRKELSITEESPFGESKPVEDNASDLGKAKNRRVEITVTFMEIPEIQKDDIQDLYAILEQKKQTFCINSDRDTILLLDQGTIIHIPAKCFISNGSCVSIEAKEVYKKSDMLMENLSTSSNGKQLESGGMIFLSAKNDRGTDLKPNKDIAVFMPTTDLKPGMKLFKGVRDPHQEMNWQGLESPISPFYPDMSDLCRNYREERNCIKCSFFMCRIRRTDDFFKGLGNKTQHSANVSFRKCQRDLRKGLIRSNTALNPVSNFNCDSILKLYETYGVTNYQDLALKMNKSLMDSLGITTYAELIAEKEKQRMRKLESDILEGKSDAQQLSYYSFQTKQMGWINCDRFTDYNGPKITMKTDLERKSDNDCKIVFKDIRSVMPNSNYKDGNYEFAAIPKGEDIYLVAMKYLGTTIFLSLELTKTTEKAPPISFKEVSLEELKEQLKILD